MLVLVGLYGQKESTCFLVTQIRQVFSTLTWVFSESFMNLKELLRNVFKGGPIFGGSPSTEADIWKGLHLGFVCFSRKLQRYNRKGRRPGECGEIKGEDGSFLFKCHIMIWMVEVFSPFLTNDTAMPHTEGKHTQPSLLLCAFLWLTVWLRLCC